MLLVLGTMTLAACDTDGSEDTGVHRTPELYPTRFDVNDVCCRTEFDHEPVRRNGPNVMLEAWGHFFLAGRRTLWTYDASWSLISETAVDSEAQECETTGTTFAITFACREDGILRLRSFDQVNGLSEVVVVQDIYPFEMDFYAGPAGNFLGLDRHGNLVLLSPTGTPIMERHKEPVTNPNKGQFFDDFTWREDGGFIVVGHIVKDGGVDTSWLGSFDRSGALIGERELTDCSSCYFRGIRALGNGEYVVLGQKPKSLRSGGYWSGIWLLMIDSMGQDSGAPFDNFPWVWADLVYAQRVTGGMEVVMKEDRYTYVTMRIGDDRSVEEIHTWPPLPFSDKYCGSSSMYRQANGRFTALESCSKFFGLSGIYTGETWHLVANTK